ncbi:uncharacterized protein LOC111032554 [Myzus persicae]|uniref:uncharacterized protein LOC111032554 n=1 Tax=Myzus persicae TaxID=13164 RepID=UPI000B9393C1|nr:uncharacterized protein LOC111032554 [Myzus persicae]
MIENNKRTSCNLENYDTILSTDSDIREKNPKRKQSENLNITRELPNELKESRPIPPVLPVQPNTEEINENDTFFKYLSIRMAYQKKLSLNYRMNFSQLLEENNHTIFSFFKLLLS